MLFQFHQLQFTIVWSICSITVAPLGLWADSCKAVSNEALLKVLEVHKIREFLTIDFENAAKINMTLGDVIVRPGDAIGLTTTHRVPDINFTSESENTLYTLAMVDIDFGVLYRKKRT